jgi:hypothetical protein
VFLSEAPGSRSQNQRAEPRTVAVRRLADASRLVGTYLANALIPLYESPTIRPAVSGKGSAGIKVRLWKTRYVMNIGGGGLLRNFSGVLTNQSNCTLRAPNGGGRPDGVTVPVPVCTLAQQPRSRDTDLANSRCHAETPPDYCIFGWDSQSAKVTLP